jgi:glutathione-specific gamma-glutamylcyclotransferase
VTAPKDEIRLTRDNIVDGTLRRWLTRSDPNLKMRSEAEHRAEIATLLAARHDGGGDVWVFGYGSLIWNPAIHTVERRMAELRGYHRRFCLWTHLGRGSAECPGLMLALERGGSCRGVAYRLATAEAEHELLILWQREMVTGAYSPRWVKVRTPEGPLAAITFAINRTHSRYAGRLSEAEIAATIARAEGALGRCCSYLFSTVEHLRELGLGDRPLERLAARVKALRDQHPVAPPPAPY